VRQHDQWRLVLLVVVKDGRAAVFPPLDDVHLVIERHIAALEAQFLEMDPKNWTT
jgi:hypothetical protein